MLPKLAFVRMSGCPKLLSPLPSRPALLRWAAQVRAMPGSGTYTHGFFEVDFPREAQAVIDTGCRCRHCEGLYPPRDAAREAEYEERKAAYQGAVQTLADAGAARQLARKKAELERESACHRSEARKAITAYDGPLAKLSDEALEGIYGAGGPSLRKFAVATHVVLGVEWWADWMASPWDPSAAPDFEAFGLTLSAERPAGADADRGGMHMHVVGLNTAKLMARCSPHAQHTLLPTCTYIPEELGDLESLVELDLSGLQCVKSLVHLPEGLFSKLKQLRRLKIGWKVGQITSLPASLGGCVLLEELDVASNPSLSGTLSVGTLSRLRVLDASGTNFDRVDGLANLHSLRKLTLGDTRHGRSPPQNASPHGHGDGSAILQAVSDLVGLESLQLSLCRLTHVPAAALLNKPNLRELRLTDMDSLASLPEALSTLKNLRHLSVFQCGGGGGAARASSTGSQHDLMLPRGLGSLVHLEKLSFCKSRLTSLPAEIGNLRSLQHLRLTGGDFTRLPDEIGRLRSLEYLDLGSCKKLKELPSSLGNLTELFSLEISCCPELASIPMEDLASLPKLTFVRMTKCAKLLAPPTDQDQLLQWVAKVRAMPATGTYQHGLFEVDLSPEQQKPIDTGCRCRHCKEHSTVLRRLSAGRLSRSRFG